ncbi:MAG: Stp1/IreP family PP2C-type Ser/Thr phosphatase [Chloroherpetonaceae bacterium]|nr:Stp1/IreP family PP2C-type Ser/Thr phosphatase [Chthonomonadaceae bacterium]MDW8206667.1 Stp1/IreP family PP2C-type Ser/Thr phosphatase [Chloroherpetonaceae bacterium]
MLHETVNFSIGFKTHVGRVREVNEDSFAIFRRRELADELDALIVVADGMGGARSGDVASRIVAETVPEAVQEVLFEPARGTRDIARILRDAIERANARIFARQAERRDLSGMGTTCIAAALKGNQLTIGHAGDSRVYLLRSGQLRQVTQDHSEVWQEVLAGRMTREEAARSKFRNSITKAVGLQQTAVNPDLETLELQEGDVVLICTDGLSTEVSDAEIARILASTPAPQEACDRLVEAALRHGGSDNITVVALYYGTPVPIAAPVMAPVETIASLEEEPSTDPEPPWRTSTARGERAAVLPRPPAPQEDEETGNSHYAAREQAQGGSNITTVVITLLILLCIAEGVALFLLSKNRVVQAPAIPDSKALRMRALDPDAVDFETAEFVYGNPRELYKKKDLRPDFLIVEPFDSVIVMDQKGALIRVTDDGKVYRMPGPPVGGIAKWKPGPIGSVAFDLAGNRYQSDPGQRGVQKYDVSGTRRSADITNGQTLRPTAIGIHPQGHLYVIDEGVLIRFEAFEDRTGSTTTASP